MNPYSRDIHEDKGKPLLANSALRTYCQESEIKARTWLREHYYCSWITAQLGSCLNMFCKFLFRVVYSTDRISPQINAYITYIIMVIFFSPDSGRTAGGRRCTRSWCGSSLGRTSPRPSLPGDSPASADPCSSRTPPRRPQTTPSQRYANMKCSHYVHWVPIIGHLWS